jgi:hypothetical protein
MNCHICDTDNNKYSCDHYNKKVNNSITIEIINIINNHREVINFESEILSSICLKALIKNFKCKLQWSVTPLSDITIKKVLFHNNKSNTIQIVYKQKTN